MYLIFVDESGSVMNWDDDTMIREQPFYILSAVAIPAAQIHSVYSSLRRDIGNLSLPHTNADKLGCGEEIKAKSVDEGKCFWGEHPELRERVRELYLNQQDVTYFLVCLDKLQHKTKYSSPKDPSQLALQFLFERLQRFLQDQDTHGFVLIDANKLEEAEQREWVARNLMEGSSGIAYSKFYLDLYEWHLEITNILEVHFGDSKHSLGLQIADFVARHAYSWRKANKSPDYHGWSLIEPRLYKYPNHVGWGYKEFPLEGGEHD